MFVVVTGQAHGPTLDPSCRRAPLAGEIDASLLEIDTHVLIVRMVLILHAFVLIGVLPVGVAALR